MAGSTINPRWTLVRAQGIERVAIPFERPPAEQPGIAGRRTLSLLSHHCPACAGALRDDDELVAVPLGPGVDEEARQAQRRGEWYDAPAIVCHKRCVGDWRPAVQTAAGKLATAAAMVREAATQVSERIRAHQVPEAYDPTPDLLSIAESADTVSKDLSGWEEQLV